MEEEEGEAMERIQDTKPIIIIINIIVKRGR